MTSINWDQLFYYEDGRLYWRISPAYRIKEYTLAGNKTGPGYWQVCYRGKFYKLHRVIWEMFNGRVPDDMEVDHIDRDLDNNSIDNLRLATRIQNSYNRGVQKNNKLGIKGVSKTKNGFTAYIRIANRTVNLGTFSTEDEASLAYQLKLNEVH